MGGESHDETFTGIHRTIGLQSQELLTIRCKDTSIQNGVSDSNASIESNKRAPAETINGAGPDAPEDDSEAEQRVDSTRVSLTCPGRLLIL